MYKSPVERLVAEGKAAPISPEATERLLSHMKRNYVPRAIEAQRRNRAAGEKIKDIPLF